MSLVVQCADEVSTQPLALMGIQFHTHSRNHVPNGLLRLNLDREKNRSHNLCVSQQIDRNIECLPSTSDVSNVTLAALRRPAGKLSPIFSNFSRNNRPPFLLLALERGRTLFLDEQF